MGDNLETRINEKEDANREFSENWEKAQEWQTVQDLLEDGDSGFVVLSKKEALKEDTSPFENRELSWLRFNERVLEEAEDPKNPLCERLQFLSIYQSNLDEFFMVRVGSIHDQMLTNNKRRENKTFLTPKAQLMAIFSRVRKLSTRFGKAYEELMQLVKEEGIRIVNFSNLTRDESLYLEKFFKKEILPFLSPVVVGKKQPFPFLYNKSLYAVCTIKNKSEKNHIGIVPCTMPAFKRLIPIPSHRGEYILSEELILHFLPLVFRRYTVEEKSILRITRNADIDPDNAYDEDLDYRALMEKLVKNRRRLCPIRLEYNRTLQRKTIGKLCKALNLSDSSAFQCATPLDLSFFSTIKSDLYNNTELFYEKFQPQKSPMMDENRSIMEQVAEKDVLLYYPYERIQPMIAMLSEAAKDPEVISIRMTLYRLAKNSQVIQALCEAAENGKQVDVLVELKARFDEENNIHWSHLLENAGCHVMYGLGIYKVHSKLLLITKKKGEEVSYITQIGTGNYNENTARLYTDLCFMTGNREIAENANKIFTALCLGEIPDQIETLLCAPRCLQNRVLDLIDQEIRHAQNGEPAYIGLKLNSLTDKDIILKLVEASKAGVQIDMVIRGINCLRSGIPGYTENIHVYSIVGRYLEHARIYIFGTRDREKVYISSADFMTRNTLRRVEVGVPIEREELRDKIHRIFEAQLQDSEKAREQRPNGNYRKKKQTDSEELFNSQEHFIKKAYENSQN